MSVVPQTPLIAHVIHHLRVGGLENGLVNLINRMPAETFRHAIICIDDYSDFRDRLRPGSTAVYALHKPPGKSVRILRDLYLLFRQIRPTILHSRNIAGLDSILPAYAAGVRCRIHGEHGWDVHDLDGRNAKQRLLRRLHRPFVDRFVALSKHLERYLVDSIGVPAEKVSQIYNGVDTVRFRPRRSTDPTTIPSHLARGRSTVTIGTIGRMQGVKNQTLLVDAFHRALRNNPDLRDRLRLVIIGDGPERDRLAARIDDIGIRESCWLPGMRNDVPELLRDLDVFVLPSLAEGISNTILEAMATGLPVIATKVGGNPELVQDGLCGFLTPPGDAGDMADRIIRYAQSDAIRHSHGQQARRRALELFDLGGMVNRYTELYRELLHAKGITSRS